MFLKSKIIFMKKTFKVAYLLDKNNFWIEKYIKKSNLLKKGKFVPKIFTDHKKIRNYEIVFILFEQFYKF